MRSIVITTPGTEDNVELVYSPDPEPATGQVRIDVAYCGCNFADTMLRRGTYPHTVDYPFSPGFEVSGVISALGDGVTTLAIGDRVAGFVESGGGYATHCVADVAPLFRLPDTVGFDVAAAFPLQALTAWHMLHTLASIQQGDTVLIHAVGGGVGLYTTQIAVHAGARVIGTIGTAGKDTRALELGVSRVVHRDQEDFVAVVQDETDGHGVDLVIDSLGATTLDRSFGCVRKLGHVISIGEAEGLPFQNIRERLLPRSLTFTRFHLGHVEPGSTLARHAERSLLEGIDSGWLIPPIADVYPLEQALEMQLALESRTVSGKLLLRVASR